MAPAAQQRSGAQQRQQASVPASSSRCACAWSSTTITSYVSLHQSIVAPGPPIWQGPVVLQPEALDGRKQADRTADDQPWNRHESAGHHADQSGDIQRDDQPSSASVTRNPAIVVIQRDAQQKPPPARSGGTSSTSRPGSPTPPDGSPCTYPPTGPGTANGSSSKPARHHPRPPDIPNQLLTNRPKDRRTPDQPATPTRPRTLNRHPAITDAPDPPQRFRTVDPGLLKDRG